MSRIDEIRANLAKRQGSFERDNSVFPFWNIGFDASTTLRLLPYSDPLTGMFWTEKVMIPMMFVDPDDEKKTIIFKAPCREMYDRDPKNLCPLLVPVRALYKEAEELKNAGQDTESKRLVKIAGLHWKKPTFYYQGFVIKAGFNETEEAPENPIRVFPFVKQIHKIIETSLDSKDDPFEFLPTGDFTEEDIAALTGEIDDEAELERILAKFEGHNFIAHKTKQGDYPNWTVGTGWVRSSKAMLTDEQIAAIAEHGYHDLTLRLPERPSDEKYEVLREMMDVSIDRLLNGGDGFWNKEWEAAGIKPTSGRRTEDSTQESVSTANTKVSSASKLKSKLTAGGGNVSTNALDKIRKARGVKTESTDEVAAAPSASDAVKAPVTNVKDLAAKIRSRIGQEA